MTVIQTSKTNPNKYSRCDDRISSVDHDKNPAPIQKEEDVEIKENIYQAFWRDNILRMIEYYEINVYVKNRIVLLSGHIVDSSRKSLIEIAVEAVPGIREIYNELVFDDELTADVAVSLEKLELAYDCKFFTSVSHGVVYLNGLATNANVKLLAEQSAAGNPNVRGVINRLLIPGDGLDLQERPFLQPCIGENIYFLDGIYGVVKQVIINPNNRCVIAMVIQGQFEDHRPELKNEKVKVDEAHLQGQTIVLPVMAIRYLTRVSGFLDIHSNEMNRYMKFDAACYFRPEKHWKPPYPYCPEDILFPVDLQDMENKILQQLSRYSYSNVLEGQTLTEQLTMNDSLGG